MEPFRFTSLVELPEILGKRARDEQELLEQLEDVPVDSIYTHTAARHLRFKVTDSMFPNDFASWAAREVRDQVLGERLGVIDPFDFPSLEALRNELISVLDDHLSRITVVPRVIHGEPFYFMRVRFIDVPTGIEAHDLDSFVDALARVDLSAIYVHTVEARMRKGIAEGDFARWIANFDQTLALKIARLSPFSSNLETMRQQIISMVREARGTRAKEKAA